MPVISLSEQCILDLRREVDNLTESIQSTTEQSEKDKLQKVLDDK